MRLRAPTSVSLSWFVAAHAQPWLGGRREGEKKRLIYWDVSRLFVARLGVCMCVPLAGSRFSGDVGKAIRGWGYPPSCSCFNKQDVALYLNYGTRTNNTYIITYMP
ncbi:uncharacterized protein LY79DRAFT_535111, partial [Colletotrichum navitas]